MSATRKPRSSLFRTRKQPITVIVGWRDDIFYFYEDLLVQHSEFFAAAMRKQWREADERTVELPEDHAEHFELFASFINTGKIHSMQDDAADDAEWNFLNAVLDALISKLVNGKRHPTNLHEYVYPYTAGDCGLRRLMVDIAAFEWDEGRLEAMTVSPACAVFFRDLAVRCRNTKQNIRKEDASYRTDDCVYHEHGDKLCYRTLYIGAGK
ncbi:hypothetical protein B0A55_04444 [Friedmanniomyces simplex]|uniref:BTB domain-containing protein n=1 Tax=Friedmanniomyces simplex TaxID=329884 RepID=A0A4U0XCS1_9PEZI|nr:hypothetical protein B0A55_04444 [Friedmanniomyces simplex]